MAEWNWWFATGHSAKSDLVLHIFCRTESDVAPLTAERNYILGYQLQSGICTASWIISGSREESDDALLAAEFNLILRCWPQNYIKFYAIGRGAESDLTCTMLAVEIRKYFQCPHFVRYSCTHFVQVPAPSFLSCIFFCESFLHLFSESFLKFLFWRFPYTILGGLLHLHLQEFSHLLSESSAPPFLSVSCTSFCRSFLQLLFRRGFQWPPSAAPIVRVSLNNFSRGSPTPPFSGFAAPVPVRNGLWTKSPYSCSAGVPPPPPRVEATWLLESAVIDRPPGARQANFSLKEKETSTWPNGQFPFQLSTRVPLSITVLYCTLTSRCKNVTLFNATEHLLPEWT